MILDRSGTLSLNQAQEVEKLRAKLPGPGDCGCPDGHCHVLRLDGAGSCRGGPATSSDEGEDVEIMNDSL